MTEVFAQSVSITVNGAERRVPTDWTLADLLESLEVDARTVVIERNRTILRDRSAFDSLELAPDDQIEIVHFVGGG
ncbi:MAG TPA: sulfur carrier protein ThiS [Gemmatimonadaceae bacterium]